MKHKTAQRALPQGSHQIFANLPKGAKSARFQKRGHWALTKCCFPFSRKQRFQLTHPSSSAEMAATCIVECKYWINAVFKVLKTGWHLVCCETKKSEITMDFKHWLCSCLCSRIKTKWTCVVHPNCFENRVIAIDELSLSNAKLPRSHWWAELV